MVVIAKDEEVRDGRKLSALLEQYNATIMQLTPSGWRLLLDSGWAGKENLTVLSGGEGLPRELARELRHKCSTVWNLYGPTETTVYSTIWEVAKDIQSDDFGPVECIGRPIANTSIYILDEDGRPVPIGMPGQLWIGGDGLAKGYLGRPELTAEKFVDNPFVSRQRMYHTGDLARFKPDGRIDFIGRIDHQIKLRGFRIELGEIEKILQQHPAIERCAVILQYPGLPDARLVAFCVTDENGSLNSGELKAYLGTYLPDYMIPAFFIKLNDLPLTPNGKLDRKALVVPDNFEINGITGSNAIVDARDTIELRLIQVFKEILKTKHISRTDSFFDLGGHSLTAVRLMARIATEFRQHLPLATLFRNSSAASLAGFLRNNSSDSNWQTIIPLSVDCAEPDCPEVFCIPGAGGNALYLQPLSRVLSAEVNIFAFQPPGLDGRTEPHQQIAELSAYYVRELTKFRPNGSYILAGHSFGGLVAYEMARQIISNGGIVKKLIILDSAAPHLVNPTGLDWSDAAWFKQIADIASHQFETDVSVTSNELNNCVDSNTQLELLHSRLIACGILPEDSPINHFRGFVAVYKANLMMEYESIPEKTLNVSTLIIRSADHQPAELTNERAHAIRNQQDLGWNLWLTNSPVITETPGDHLSMLNQPHVVTLADVLREKLLNNINQITNSGK
jgi:thioesterase domain-containing protein/acyl carrier protein